jgi:hypothetical protein
VRHYAVIIGFELADVKTDPTRFIAKCKAEGCGEYMRQGFMMAKQ